MFRYNCIATPAFVNISLLKKFLFLLLYVCIIGLFKCLSFILFYKSHTVTEHLVFIILTTIKQWFVFLTE